MSTVHPGRGPRLIAPAAERGPVAAPKPDDGGPQTALSDLKVMVVDDEFLAAWHLQAMLEDMGVTQVEIAHDGPSALAMAERLAPDLVLMDMNLGPGIDGAETARRLLARAPARLIFITAYGDPATQERIQSAAPGADILLKPANPARLYELIAGPRAH